MSPGGGNRTATKCVVDDFSSRSGQHVDRIGSRLAPDTDAKHQFRRIELVANLADLFYRKLDNRGKRRANTMRFEFERFVLAWLGLARFRRRRFGLSASGAAKAQQKCKPEDQAGGKSDAIENCSRVAVWGEWECHAVTMSQMISVAEETTFRLNIFPENLARVESVFQV